MIPTSLWKELLFFCLFVYLRWKPDNDSLVKAQQAFRFSNMAQQERDAEGKQAEIITSSHMNNENMNHLKKEPEHTLSWPYIPL